MHENRNIFRIGNCILFPMPVDYTLVKIRPLIKPFFRWKLEIFIEMGNSLLRFMWTLFDQGTYTQVPNEIKLNNQSVFGYFFKGFKVIIKIRISLLERMAKVTPFYGITTMILFKALKLLETSVILWYVVVINTGTISVQYYNVGTNLHTSLDGLLD